MTLATVLVAAGKGRRLGRDEPKALVEVAGRTLLEHALRRVELVDAGDIVVVHPPEHASEFRAVCERFPVTVLVAGGAARSDSVRAGLDVLSGSVRTVAIHDAARAFTPPVVFTRAIAAVRDGAIAAAPGIAVRDTLKRVKDGQVLGTVPREGLWAVQTPQVFRRDVLETALRTASGPSTDELSLVEEARDRGLVEGDVVMVQGSYRSTKVTYGEDLELAEELASETLEAP